MAAPRGFSQPITSFIASWRQGIHQMPFLYLIVIIEIPSRTGINPAPDNPPHDTEYCRNHVLHDVLEQPPKGLQGTGIRKPGSVSRATRLASHQRSPAGTLYTNSLERISGLSSQPTNRTGYGWWAWEDLNFRPHAYQARALTKLSYRPGEQSSEVRRLNLVELNGIEPMTSCLQSRRSPN